MARPVADQFAEALAAVGLPTVMTGRGDRVLDLARSNLRR